MHCRQWNAEEGGMPSVGCQESGMLSGGMWCVECEVGIAECGV